LKKIDHPRNHILTEIRSLNLFLGVGGEWKWSESWHIRTTNFSAVFLQ